MFRSSTMAPASLLALSLGGLLAFAVGCPTPPGPGGGEGEGEGEGEEGEGEGEGEEGEGEPVGTGDCPVVAGGNSVCDVQDGASDNAVAPGALVTLPNVTATSDRFIITRDDAGDATRFGVYVTDLPVKARSGVLVTFEPGVAAPAEIAIGDVLTVVGTADEVTIGAPNSETRIQAQTITAAAGAGATPVAIVVDAADLASEVDGEDFEGVLVTVEGVAVTAIGQFGQFTVSGGVVTDDTIFQYSAVEGETLTSITGVVGYNIFDGGGFRLLPRQASDVVSDERPTETVTALNDGTIARCPGDGQFFQCVAAISGVVSSPPFFISEDPERGELFGFYIADPAAIDGEGRQLPDSGILVTISPNDTRSPPSLEGYTFEQDGRLFVPGAAPEVGDTVELTGDNAERFGERAVRFTSQLKKVSTGAVLKGALFNVGGTGGANDVADLKGGRPDAPDGDFPGLENVAGAAGLDQWEGVLVELEAVTTTNPCYEQIFDPNRTTAGDAFGRDFGNFLVTGDVEIGDAFRMDRSFGGFYFGDPAIPAADQTCGDRATKCEDSRVLNQTFVKLVGIVNFSFNVHRVNPRSQADVVATPGFVDEGTPVANCP